MIVVLQESREIFESGQCVRVMETPLGKGENEGFGWSRTHPGLVHYERELLRLSKKA